MTDTDPTLDDLTTETNDDLLNPNKLNAVAAALKPIPDTDLSCHADEFLAEHTAALKRIENAAENARKNGYENELDDRVAAGEFVGPLRKRSGRNTWVSDTEGAFAAVAAHGDDPLDVATVSIGDLRDVLGDRAAEAYIDESSYTYFVRR